MIALSPRSVAHALGGQVAGSNVVLAPGPGHSRHDRSLAIKLEPSAPDGFLIRTYSPRDDWRGCRDYVRMRLGLPAWQPGDRQNRRIPNQHVPKWDLAAVEAEAEQPPQSWTAEQTSRIASAQRVWNEGQDPRGTLAETYLREHRRLDLPADLAWTVLRFHPHCPWRDENTGRTIAVPALIVPFRSIQGDHITGIHRIALQPDGSKIDRRMLGVIAQAAVKIDPLPGAALTIGEGIETVLAGRQYGFNPAWALGSAGAISKFPVIDGVQQLTVLGEPGAEAAVSYCGKRWRKAGRRVRVVRSTIGSDLNDALITESAAQ